MIAVEPELADGASQPTDAAIAAAKAKADQALADLQGRQGLGHHRQVRLHRRDQGQGRRPRLHRRERDARRGVPRGTADRRQGRADRGHRGRGRHLPRRPRDRDRRAGRGRDAGQQVADAGISLDDFRAALGRDVTRAKLSDAILAAVPGPGPAAPGARRSSCRPAPARRARPRSASATSSTRPTTTPRPRARRRRTDDPAWAKAEAEAKATCEKLKADPSLFDSIARAESDEDSAVTTGGKLPYFSTDDQLDQDFADAIFSPASSPASCWSRSRPSSAGT